MDHRRDIDLALDHLLLDSLDYSLLKGGFVGDAVLDICTGSMMVGPGRDPQVYL